MRNIIYISICLLLHPIASEAQELKPYHLRLKPEQGFVMIHTPKLDYIIQEHIEGFEIEWQKQTYGNKDWHQRYKYPTWGVLYSMRNLGNDDLLGNGHAIIFNTHFPIMRKEKWNAGFTVGTGPAIIEKTFHRISNHKNIAIGSKLNLAIKFETNIAYKINNNMAMGAALAFNHYSNGAFTSPNLGLNIPTFGLYYQHSFGEKKPLNIQELKSVDKSYEKAVALMTGVKEIAPPGGHKFFVLAASFSYCKVFGYKSRLGGGVDLIHDPSAGERLQRDSISYTLIDNIKTGLFLSHEWIISDFSLITQAGVYVYAKKSTEGSLYQRIGFRYSFYKKYFINVSLKTHFANADYGEWGLGYRF